MWFHKISCWKSVCYNLVVIMLHSQQCPFIHKKRLIHALALLYPETADKHKSTDTTSKHTIMLAELRQIHVFMTWAQRTTLHCHHQNQLILPLTAFCTECCASPGIITITVTSTVVVLLLFLGGSLLLSVDSLVRSMTFGLCAVVL